MKSLVMSEIKVIDCVTKKGVKFANVMTPFQEDLSNVLINREWSEVYVHNVVDGGKTTAVLASLIDMLYREVLENVSVISPSKKISHQTISAMGYANGLSHTPKGLSLFSENGDMKYIKVTDTQGLKRETVDVLVVFNQRFISGLEEMIQQRGNKISKIIYINDSSRVHVGVKEE